MNIIKIYTKSWVLEMVQNVVEKPEWVEAKYGERVCAAEMGDFLKSLNTGYGIVHENL